jgi:hypothetical protein
MQGEFLKHGGGRKIKSAARKTMVLTISERFRTVIYPIPDAKKFHPQARAMRL